MKMNSPQGIGFSLPGLHGMSQSTRRASSYRTNGIPFLKFLPNGVRNHLIAMLCEFLGTFLFLFFAYSGTQAATARSQNADLTSEAQGLNPSQLLYISLCFGFSLAVNAWVFFRVSGGLFNPAVALGMSLIGALPWSRSGLLVIPQILGAIAASATVSVLFPGPLNVRTLLGQGTTTTQGLFIEMFLTAQLVFTTFMLAAQEHRGTNIAPVGIGLSLFIAEMTGVYYTGGSVNPARSFGPSVILRSFERYHWIYWVGPILGALLASALYKFVKILERESVPLGQEKDEKDNRSCDRNREIEANFPPAEPPLVSTHHLEAFAGFADADSSTENIQTKQERRERRDSSGSEASRVSAIRKVRVASGSAFKTNSVGHIYIDETYQRAPEVEAASPVRQSYVPRTAGRS